MKKLYLLLLLGIYNFLIAQTNFHDTTGNIDVNGAGQLQYTLPIALPPGIKSVAPQVNLTYISGSGNGIAGYGWNLSGITSISRMSKTIEKDGEVKGIQLNNTDYYSFNGQRLILKSGSVSYGGNGAEYVTEKYSNVKIKSLGSIMGQTWQGPEYWEVTFEDGSQAWYGATTTGISNARTPIEYNIVKWKDAQGNYITYNYTQANNVAVISSIQWGGNETIGKSHFNQIIFNYIIRDLKETSYLNGVKFLQDKLLSNVVVNTSATQFKKYVINYAKDYVDNDSTKPINYQFVSSIQEYNSQNEAANPITFSTKTPVSTTYESAFGDFDNVISTGDYNGDGLVDFIVSQPAQNGKPEGYYVYFDSMNNANPSFVYLGTRATYFPTYSFNTFNIKPSDNIVRAKQGILLIKNTTQSNPPSTGNIELKYYSIKYDASTLNTYNNPLQLEYSKTISASQYEYDESLYTINPPTDYDYTSETKKSQLLNPKEIDIDSDGLSELIFTVSDSKCYNQVITPTPLKTRWQCNNLGNRYVIIDNTDLTSGSLHILPPTSKNILSKGGIVDFDNDGTQDIIFVEPTGTNSSITYSTDLKIRIETNTISTPNNTLSQFALTKTGSSYNIALKKTYSVKGLSDGIQFADFNGDRNIEILLPLSIHLDTNATPTTNPELYKTTGWAINLNTGNNLQESYQGLTNYNPNPVIESGAITRIYRHFVTDIDMDGKSDFISTTSTINYTNSVYKTYLSVGLKSEFQFDENGINGIKWKSLTKDGFNKVYDRLNVTPIFSDFRINNNNSKIQFLTNNVDNPNDRKIISYYNYSLNIDKNINSITQGNIVTEIDYKELVPSINQNLYSPVKQEQYPYLEFDQVGKSFVVSQLRQEGIKRDFLYRGYIAHLQGRGVIGFRQTARSSWYATGYENTIIWAGAEIDPLNESLPIKDWSIKTNDANQVFPTNIDINNTNLLSVKLTNYSTTTLANGVKVILPTTSTSKDFLKDITSVSTMTYGNYYLPIKSVTNINNGYSISTTDLVYINNYTGSGKDYYIGRPSSKIETVYYQPTNDTKSAKQEYTYNSNNLLATLKTWNRDNSGWLQETCTYDAGNMAGFGNITKKVISNSIDTNTITEEATFDTLGRFVIGKKDNLGLITNITYNNWGQVLTQTDPFGVVLTNTYDNWGKTLTSKTNLSATVTYTYEKLSNGDAKVTETVSTGEQKITYTNKIGQNYKTTTKAFKPTNSYISVESQYDVLGRKTAYSEPYFEGSVATKWNTVEYDDYSRPKKATSFTGKIVETTYSGSTVTVTETNSTGKFKKQTVDAVGYTISTEDKGGVINFKYNASGENTEAKYDTNVVTNKYDAWGRKTEFYDPSNGKYTYEYNDGFGKLTKETSPSLGYKQYTYNALGQITNQIEYLSKNNVVLTNKSISYSYNTKGQITDKSCTSLGKSFNSSITYDTYGRLTTSTENNTTDSKSFYKNNVVYDTYGRVTSYTKGLTSSGITTATSIEHAYDTWSGALYQVKNKANGDMLWELQSINEKGQILTEKLGATSITNAYDFNNFLSSINHSSTAKPNILNISYSFNAIKNELNSRITGGDFNITEYFTYDDNNRLINWTNPRTGQLSNNIYDAKGRITQNDQLGTIQYNNAQNIYRPSGMTLNANGIANYDNQGTPTSTLIQSITYNENNDPIKIDGIKGDYAFDYGLSNSRQVMYYGGNFTTNSGARYIKYYNESGDTEIIKDTQTGKEKHILYIGGSPYESNIVFLKNYTETSGSFKFLHKDYLGSILAISDEAGNKLEQRHFDAWGNVTHLKIGNNATITDRNTFKNTEWILDRGYTSHEHLKEVEIIHMNGRLYDPLLRRFLNADENIQDPTNTQNYNKYGYVMNNPLMYSDPSGEFIFAFFAFLPVFWGTVATAAVIGSMVGVGMYIIQAAITGNYSINGLTKAMLMGAVTGAISGGLGQVFSASGFWASVGNGALAGAGSGGVASLINGQNFLDGLMRGALFGGVISGISWGINQLVSKPSGQSLDVLDNTEETSGTPVNQSSKEVKKVMKNDFKGKNPTNSSVNVLHKEKDLPNYLKERGYKFDGKTLINKNGEKVLAVTTPFYGNKYMRYVFAPNSFKSYEILSLTTGHEMLHGLFLSNGIDSVELATGAWNQAAAYPTNHHAIIAEWEKSYINLKGWQNLNLPQETLYNLEMLKDFNIGFNANFDKMMKLMKNFLK